MHNAGLSDEPCQDSKDTCVAGLSEDRKKYQDSEDTRDACFNDHEAVLDAATVRDQTNEHAHHASSKEYLKCDQTNIEVTDAVSDAVLESCLVEASGASTSEQQTNAVEVDAIKSIYDKAEKLHDEAH